MRRAAHDRPRVGISRCLLGDAVRYDGGHKRARALVATLGPKVEWVPVCPEVEAGMSIPREPVQLVAAGRGGVRLVGVETGHDWTHAMNRWSKARVRALAAMGLSGYVLKNGSPSCGLQRVPVQDAAHLTRTGRGLFAHALLEALPNLPVEEETSLRDAGRIADFLERVHAYHRARRMHGRASRSAPGRRDLPAEER